MTTPPLIALSDIIKDFPGTRALDRVSFDVKAGEIHSLVGENGAGKSTLIKTMSGIWAHGSFEGGIEVEGHPVEFRSIRDATAAGIAVIYQELALAPEMTVAENIFLGREPLRMGTIDYATMTTKAHTLLQDLRIDINPAERVGNLGVGHQQMVEIAKALSRDFKLLILDEPTASLSESEVTALLILVKKLRERGKGIIYISHRLNEVLELSDRITVLRDGTSVETLDIADTTEAILINRMVGRDLNQVFPQRDITPGEIALELNDLSMAHPHLPGRKMLEGISFQVRKGEVLGIAGLIGAGRTELLECLFGTPRAPWKGCLSLHGKPVQIRTPRDAVRNKLVLVTEDRKGNGLVLDHPIRVNASLVILDQFCTAGWIDESAESVAVNQKCQELRVKAPNNEINPEALSGG
ncbi:D-xylose ABC transporter ATP-binding protein, partial [bacterium M21]